MILRRGFVFLSLLLIILTGCQISMKNKTSRALDLNNLDRSVSPGADFYHYAVGSWLKKNPIPAEYSSWGSFNILAEENLHRLKEIMGKAERVRGKGYGVRGHVTQLVGDFYATGMDESKIEREGIAPLKVDLDWIAGISDKKELEIGRASCRER